MAHQTVVFFQVQNSLDDIVLVEGVSAWSPLGALVHQQGPGLLLEGRILAAAAHAAQFILKLQLPSQVLNGSDACMILKWKRCAQLYSSSEESEGDIVNTSQTSTDRWLHVGIVPGWPSGCQLLGGDAWCLALPQVLALLRLTLYQAPGIKGLKCRYLAWLSGLTRQSKHTSGWGCEERQVWLCREWSE